MTDHYLLMTATPHKGDRTTSACFLRLLDNDVYGMSKPEEAMCATRTLLSSSNKGWCLSVPTPAKSETLYQAVRHTVPFQRMRNGTFMTPDRYVEDQSIKAQAADSTTGRVIGFTMAMLQRRMASHLRRSPGS